MGAPLFAELFACLVSSRGHAGIIVPTGIATDATTAPFFAALVSGKRLAQLIDFENRERLFPAVDSRMKFSLVTIGREEKQSRFAFFLTDPRQLVESERRFTLSAEEIELINPNTKTAPVFRSRTDAELTAKIYARVPVLIDEAKGAAGNPWGVSFMAMFHMANDSGLFRTAAQLRQAGFVRDGSDWIMPPGAAPRQSALALTGGRDDRSLELLGGAPGRSTERYVPLYEAKMVSFYDHRAASYGTRGENRGYRVLPSTSHQDHSQPHFEIEPFYWVPKLAVEERLEQRAWSAGWLIGWKDITAATNERTLIPALIPRVGCGDTFLLAFPAERSGQAGALLAANWSSIIADYAARQKVSGLHLKYNIFKQFPVLPPSLYAPADLSFVVPRVLELTYTSHSMAPLARDLGYDSPPFVWDDNRRSHLRAELDAWYARAYGLTRDELRYILDPAEVKGPDYPSETFRVLKKNEVARFGEYRTARLVLAAYDQLTKHPLAAE
jgi:hypothetical protein